MTKKSEKTPEDAIAEAFNEGYKAGRESMRTDIISKLETLEIKPSLTNALGMKYMAKRITQEIL
jgi:flagellar biosynthesis/type III secretory pathway protein FliH